MNVVFMGTPDFSVKILEAVHLEYGVNLVVTQPDKLVGRKKVLTFSPVKVKALELGIEVFQPVIMKEDYAKILEVKPDIIIECGTNRGGSALYFASICDLINNGEIITIDINDAERKPIHKRIRIDSI